MGGDRRLSGPPGTKQEPSMLQEDLTAPSMPTTLKGVLKSFHNGNGWGFVECREAYDMYGKDILVLREDLEGLPRTPGTRFSFTITEGRNGPLARNLRCLGEGTSALPMTTPV